MKKLTLFAMLAAVLLCGCVKPVVVSEVLQQGEKDVIYTQCNIFYSDPANISCLNFLEGKFIPYGTEITVVECDEEKLSFKTAGSETVYTIKFSKGERMSSMQNYLRTILGFTDRSGIEKKIRPEFAAEVRAGKIAVGMKKSEIAVAWGKVPPVHTPDEKNMTWIYMYNHHDLIRLIFRGDVLRKTMPKLQDSK